MNFIDFIVTTLGSSAIVLLVTNTILKNAINNYFNKKLNEHNHNLNKKMHDFSFMATKRFEYYADIHKQVSPIFGDIAVILNNDIWIAVDNEEKYIDFYKKYIQPFTERLFEINRLIELSNLYSSTQVMNKLNNFSMEIQFLGREIILYEQYTYGNNIINTQNVLMAKKDLIDLQKKMQSDFYNITLLMRKDITYSDDEKIVN